MVIKISWNWSHCSLVLLWKWTASEAGFAGANFRQGPAGWADPARWSVSQSESKSLVCLTSGAIPGMIPTIKKRFSKPFSSEAVIQQFMWFSLLSVLKVVYFPFKHEFHRTMSRTRAAIFLPLSSRREICVTTVFWRECVLNIHFID